MVTLVVTVSPTRTGPRKLSDCDTYTAPRSRQLHREDRRDVARGQHAMRDAAAEHRLGGENRIDMQRIVVAADVGEVGDVGLCNLALQGRRHPDVELVEKVGLEL